MKNSNSFALGLELGRYLAGLRRKKKTLVGCSYNGTVLPELPEWDRDAYPYGVITYNPLTNAHDFDVSIRQPYMSQEEKGYCLCFYSGDVMHSYFRENMTGWTVLKDSDMVGIYLFDPDGAPVLELVWTSHDIRNTDGTLLLAASEPVPVYE